MNLLYRGGGPRDGELVAFPGPRAPDAIRIAHYGRRAIQGLDGEVLLNPVVRVGTFTYTHAEQWVDHVGIACHVYDYSGYEEEG